MLFYMHFDFTEGSQIVVFFENEIRPAGFHYYFFCPNCSVYIESMIWSRCAYANKTIVTSDKELFSISSSNYDV